MIAQSVTPDLRRWIAEQTAAGQSSAALLGSMLASGWQPQVAAGALEAVSQGSMSEEGGAGITELPASVAVPEPLPEGTRPAIWAVDREVTVVSSMRKPRVVVFANLLAPDECDEIIALSRLRLARSETVQTDTGGNEVNHSRTSQGMFFDRGEHPVCARLEARIAALTSWPLENGEGLQVLRYGPGAEYKPHYDYFDPAQAGTPTILQRGGQRVASVICYLNTPSQGGATTFPDVQLDVAPVRGNAVFFSYDRPHPMTRTLHGGAPVMQGEKWVATKWLRQTRFD